MEGLVKEKKEADLSSKLRISPKGITLQILFTTAVKHTAKVVQLVQLADSCWTKNMESGLSKCQLRNTGEKVTQNSFLMGERNTGKTWLDFFITLVNTKCLPLDDLVRGHLLLNHV